MFGSEMIVDAVVSNPEKVLLWSHGFFVALALRRGRIKMIIDRVTPGSVTRENGEKSE